MKRTIVVLLLSALCAAQTPTEVHSAATEQSTPCPVEVMDVHGFTSLTVYPWFTSLYFRNISDKTIIGFKFGIVDYDGVGDPHDRPETYSGEFKVKPGKKLYKRWENPWGGKHMTAYMIKVRFDDGTTWEDDGSRACHMDKLK